MNTSTKPPVIPPALSIPIRLLGTLALLVSSPCQAEPVLVQTDLFRQGQGGYFAYRIPSVITTSAGTVLAFMEGRKEDLQDIGNIDTLVIRSQDAGKTWTAPQVIADRGLDTIGNPCPVVDRRTGIVWLLLTGATGGTRHKDVIDGAAPHSVWITHSRDDGVTWASPVDITSSIRGKRPDQTFFANGPGNGIQLRTGRLVIPNYYRWKGSRTSYANVLYSDDGGRTWTSGGPAGDLTNECAVVELADGTLMLNMRSYAGRNRRAISRSRDGGRTWSQPVLHDELVEPVCQGSFVRLTLGKNRVLFANPADVKRRNLTVKLSYNEGATYPVARSLNDGPSAYSSLVALPDGFIGCFYERGERGPYEKLTFARFNLEWLSGGSDRDQR